MDKAPKEHIAVVVGTALSKEEVAALYGRLPDVAEFETEKSEFSLRSTSLPAPRKGEFVGATFPPSDEGPGAPRQECEGLLEVLRFQPEGEIARPRRVSVTFSHPMVAVTSHGDAVGAKLPVKLSPEPAGSWRWIGTQTIVFEAEEEFPMATEYTISVARDVKSALGTVLDEAFETTFSTHPVTLESMTPGGPSVGLDPLCLLRFDQNIDPEAMSRSVELLADEKPLEHRLATGAEIAADESARRAMAEIPGKWLAIKPVQKLPMDAVVEVMVKSGAPSAEGPRLTTHDQQGYFMTHGPFALSRSRSGWGSCAPGEPFTFEFSNPIDGEVDVNELVTVSPAIGDRVVSASYNTITIQGRTQPQTTYEVRISKELKDMFGQVLPDAVQESFTVGGYPASLTANGQQMVVLDPFMPRSFSVYSVNYRQLRVKVHRVRSADWPKFWEYQQQALYRRDDHILTPPGTMALETTITVGGDHGELVETAIDLSRHLDDHGLGHVMVEIEADDPISSQPTDHGRHLPRIIRWVQSTQIGIDAYRAPEGLTVWATSLKEGSPLSGAEVEVAGGPSKERTDDQGLARLCWEGSARSYLFVRKESDEAILPQYLYHYGDSEGWFSPKTEDWVSWFVADDRQMYKPGEEVRIRGWARVLEASPRGGIRGLGEARSVEYGVTDPRGNEIGKGRTAINAFGGFDFRFELPDDANLGYAQVMLTLDAVAAEGHEYYHGFQIQEFRRPEYEVKAASDPGPHIAGESGQAWVQASYYSGGALPEAEVHWLITRSSGHYSPPNWPGFVFGSYRPWWWHDEDFELSLHESHQGKTDFSGEHRISLDFAHSEKHRPQAIEATATVADVNHQAWSSTTNLLVHPSRHYVGMRTQRWFYEKGKPMAVDLIATDIEGKAVTGRAIKVSAHRLRWAKKGREWVEEEVDGQECVVQSTDTPVRCTFNTPEGGRYRVVATIEDLQGRVNQSEMRIWVSGGKQPPKRNIEEEAITLIPDKEEYSVGDVAEVLVQVPFGPAEALVTLRRHGLYSTERVTIEEGSHTVKVPIEESMLPNVWFQVDAVGNSPRIGDEGRVDESLPPRPAFATGQLNLRIATDQRRLTVEVEARQPLVAPGSEVQFDVDVKDASGSPVPGAEVFVFAVDEALLALSNYQLGDPMSIFYAHRSADVYEVKSRPFVLLNDPSLAAAEESDGGMEYLEDMEGASMLMADHQVAQFSSFGGAPGMGMVGDEVTGGTVESERAIALRENFDALAFFEPALRTDDKGRARVDVKIPDSVTRYRVMAVAVKDTTLYGTEESTLTARLPLMVRPSAPRFLNFGDQMELPVVVQNQTNRDMEVRVVVRGHNVEWTGPTGLLVTVPAQNRIEVRFPATTHQTGIARVQVGASSADWADGANIEFPVWTPATTEAFATYGVVDHGATFQPLRLPTDIYHQFGGLEVTTSSTQLQTLTDAFIYLVNYPYECAEQLASRVLSVAALRDVLTAFEAEGMPSRSAIEAMVARDLARLSQMQNHDGGFGFWRPGEDSWPYTTVHVAHAMARARGKGFDVPAQTVMRANQYLRNIEGRIPEYYSRMSRNAIRASALYVRMLLGDEDVVEARRLFGQEGTEHLSLESLGWVMSVLAGDVGSSEDLTKIRRHLLNCVEESAATAEFTSFYGDQGHLVLHSARRTDAVILDALIRAEPTSDLIPKVVEGLLAHRTRGRWSNTQENVFVLLALDHYFNVFEKVTPDFVARVWLGAGFVGEHAFKGRTTERHHVDVPFDVLAAQNGGESTLAIDKDGAGRMYYRVGMRYAPTSLEVPAVDHGFAVERLYEAVDDPDDVRRTGDNSWRIRPGARVKITVTMATPGRRYHVALVDPLPAGLEAMNPALATTANIPQDPAQMARGGHFWWWGPWYQHQNMRDERVEAFATQVYGGVHSYTYYALATTPGEFVAPPAKAEEMYHPETFGRTASAKVTVR